MTYADSDFWDQFHRQRRDAGEDLDWKGLWTEPFLTLLREAGVRTILELGCGTGNDAARLAREGYSVTATDWSGEAIEHARARFGSTVGFAVADMTQRLPFPDGNFDAVMSNVAMHMFPDRVTRALFAEVGRLVRPGGLFLFHVNALEDRPLRARNRHARELEPDYVIEESGQTMHFFSEIYLRELLGGWQELHLSSVPIPDRQTGEPYKHVWRGIARQWLHSGQSSIPGTTRSGAIRVMMTRHSWLGGVECGGKAELAMQVNRMRRR
jgi:SAM-dependent methyltransferase